VTILFFSAKGTFFQCLEINYLFILYYEIIGEWNVYYVWIESSDIIYTNFWVAVHSQQVVNSLQNLDITKFRSIYYNKEVEHYSLWKVLLTQTINKYTSYKISNIQSMYIWGRIDLLKLWSVLSKMSIIIHLVHSKM